MELGLAACLEAEVVAFAVADDLLHDGPHLVDLDGEDDEVLGLVGILLGSASEALVGLLDAVVEDVGEAQQHGCRDVACGKLIDDVLQIHLHAVLLWCHIDVTFLVDAEIVDSPAFDVVEFLGVFDAPFLHKLMMVLIALRACCGLWCVSLDLNAELVPECGNALVDLFDAVEECDVESVLGLGVERLALR